MKVGLPKTSKLFVVCVFFCVACKTKTQKENQYDENEAVEMRDPKYVKDTANVKLSTTTQAIEPTDLIIGMP
ncbi:hypothetical protein ABW636_05070 [Aquimarina sp. 2201CG1-2-11]|uniref:hypothetical protein n=1 Tax=Aquimarina discodermiae TaxID=3231043 RepID=UPI003462ADE9